MPDDDEKLEEKIEEEFNEELSKRGRTKAEGVEAGEFKVAGLVSDQYGHTWARAQYDGQDESIGGNPLEFPASERLRSEGFYVYFETEENLPQAIARGFVTVSRTEAGFSTIAGTSEYGTSEAMKEPHRVGKLYLLKAPNFIYDQINQARYRDAQGAVNPILRGMKAQKGDIDGSNVKRDDDVIVKVSVGPRPAGG